MAVSQWTLPPELWLMVFRVVNDLRARDTLKSISLTCRDFRCFTLPLLFETFVLHPLPRKLMPLSGRTDREIQRLDFYASDRIVPYVCHITVQPYIKWLAPRSEMPATVVHDNPQFLISKFVDMLPRFTNARSLTCDEIDIGLHGLKNLSALPCLRSIDLTDCNALDSLSTNDSLRPLRLHTFRAAYHTGDATGPHRWLTLMDPSSLQVLRVHIARNSSALSSGGFFRDMPSAGLFPSLHTLNLSGGSDVIRLIVQILSNTPALRRLTLALQPLMRGEEYLLNASEPPARHLVPYLEVYDGSHQLLPHILRRTRSSMESPSSSTYLRRLNLHPRLDGDGSLHALVNTLRSLCPTRLRHLTHFHASLTWVDCNALENLCVLLPELRELRITPTLSSGRFTSNVGCGLFFSSPNADLHPLTVYPDLLGRSVLAPVPIQSGVAVAGMDSRF